MNQLTDVTVDELAILMRNRASTYALLARLYRQEVDDVLLEQLRAMDISSQGTAEIITSLNDLKACAAGPDSDPTKLANEYARIFLGAGGEGSAYPYESVYTSPERLLMQGARDDVLLEYRQEGLDRAMQFHEPEDHIALELEFTAYLCQQAGLAFENHDDAGGTRYLEKQKHFVERHLLNWVSMFCQDVIRLGRSKFYEAAAKMTAEFLDMERHIIGAMVARSNEA